MLYSDDFGRTWNKSAGIDGSVLTASGQYQRRVLAADRQTADVFYINDVTNGIFYVSTDGGKTFAPSGLAYEAQEYSSFLRSSIEANPQKAGEVWFSTFESGLFKADNFGKTAKRVPYVNSVEAFSFGAPVSDSDEASMFVLAEIYGVRGLYRSDDGGKSWIKLNSSDFGLGNALEICGDKRTFGTVYVSTAGRSVLTARIPGDYTELWAKVTDTEKNAVFVEFTQALDSDTVSKTAFSVYDSAGNAVLTDDITLSRDLKTVKLTLTENLIEDNIYTVCISESIKSLSQAGVYPDYRTLKFYASELSEGVKNFHDNVADISLMYSCTEENLKKWIYYDNDDTAMTAKRQSAEVVYRVNGSITEFDVRTIHYSTSHDSQWRFYVSSDGENWTELQKNTHYTSKYVSPPEGAVYSYASYYMHTSVQGTLEAMRARYVKICYPSLYDSSSDGGESRGLLDVSIDYTYGTLVSISSENSTVEDPAFIELSFDRQMPELTEQTFTITDIDKNEYIISAVNMSETLKSCILVMQAPLADGAYTLTVDEGIKSLDGVGINSAFTSINFNVRTLTDDKIFLSDSTIVINSDVVRYSVRITSAYDGVMVKPVLAVYESGSLAAIEQIETLKLDAGGFSDVCLETAVRNLKDISVSVFLWNDYKTITPLRRKIVIKR